MSWFDKLKLPVTIGVIGYFLTTKPVLVFLNEMSPLAGFVLYYTFALLLIIFLEKIGLVISGIKLETTPQAVGTLFILYSFLLVTSLQGCYMNEVVLGKCDRSNISNIYLQSEDGALYYMWSKLFNDRQTLRIMTYVVTPFVLTLVGSLLITEKVKLSL